MNTNDQNIHHIYWADDDSDDLELFREVLEAFAPDHKVIEFRNGRTLIERLQAAGSENYPCLIVLDMNMPIMGGRDTLLSIKADEALRHIPVVVFTTSITPHDRAVFERMQTDALIKPSSFNEIRHVIESLVSRCSEAPVLG